MDKIEVSQRAREAYLSMSMLPEFDAIDVREGRWDKTTGLQAFARFERDILATRTDATPVAVEMVAELQLSAFLAGRGSIRTKANGNTHESSPGPTMDDYRRMARFALAEGQVDATPVAWMPIESAPRNGNWFLAYEPDTQCNAHYACAFYYREDGVDYWRVSCGQHVVTSADPTHWMPLPAAPDATNTHPPATDVAALVDAARDALPFMTQLRAGICLKTDGKIVSADSAYQNLSVALAPFTKGPP